MKAIDVRTPAQARRALLISRRRDRVPLSPAGFLTRSQASAEAGLETMLDALLETRRSPNQDDGPTLAITEVLKGGRITVPDDRGSWPGSHEAFIGGENAMVSPVPSALRAPKLEPLVSSENETEALAEAETGEVSRGRKMAGLLLAGVVLSVACFGFFQIEGLASDLEKNQSVQEAGALPPSVEQSTFVAE